MYPGLLPDLESRGIHTVNIATDEEEDEPLPPVQEQKRTLGLIILRGETIISISVDAPPPESKRDMPVVCITFTTASPSSLFMHMS